MALKQLNFSKSWTEPADFPTVETDETVIRQDMQQLHDETKAYLNGTLLPAIEAGYVPVERTVNGHALTADVAVTKADVGLGQVDNTADMDKPVSTAQAAAIQAVAMGQIPAGSVEKTMLAAEVAAAVGRAEEGGGLDKKIAETADQKAALLHAAQHGASGSDPVTPAAIGAVAKTGDTMTGNFSIQRDYPQITLKSPLAGRDSYIAYVGNEKILYLMNRLDVNNRQGIYITPETSSLSNAVRVIRVVNGVPNYYSILHTGNLSDFVSTQSRVVEYTGTGTTGVSVAVGFAPRIVVVQEVVNDGGTPVTLPLVLTNTGVSLGLYRNGTSGDLSGFKVTVSAFGTTVSWSCGSAAEAGNTSGKTYRLTAIG